MRRRLLLGKNGPNYVFSASTTSTSVSRESGSTSISIKSTANGSNIGYSVVSYDGTVVTGVTTTATRVTIRYSANTNFSTRTSTVVLKQSESEKTITITITQNKASISLNVDVVLLDASNGSSGSITTNLPSSYSTTFEGDFYRCTVSNGIINITSTSANSNGVGVARGKRDSVSYMGNYAYFHIIQMPNSYNSIDGYDYLTFKYGTYDDYQYIKIATKNVGASSITSYGKYYRFGAGNETYQEGSTYSTTSGELTSSEDTATQVMGGGWRMPSQSITSKLLQTSKKCIYNGIMGTALADSELYDSSFLSVKTGACLFFPNTGHYDNNSLVGKDTEAVCWTSTGLNSYGASVWVDDTGGVSRLDGYNVRGVHD